MVKAAKKDKANPSKIKSELQRRLARIATIVQQKSFPNLGGGDFHWEAFLNNKLCFVHRNLRIELQNFSVADANIEGVIGPNYVRYNNIN